MSEIQRKAAEREKERAEKEAKWAEEDRERKKKCLAEQRENPSRWLMDAYVPQKYLKASFDSFEGGKTVKELCQVAILDHESVMLCGKTGCGKTHLAVAMLRHFVSTTKNELGLRERTEDDIPRNGNDSRIMFLSVPELLLQIRGTFAKDSEQTEESVIERYSNMSLLILDDLGAEKTSEWVESTLYLIIDRRNRGQRWTIVTSNLSLEEIEQHLGARIASRLSDMKVVNIKLPDYRKKR